MLDSLSCGVGRDRQLPSCPARTRIGGARILSLAAGIQLDRLPLRAHLNTPPSIPTFSNEHYAELRLGSQQGGHRRVRV